MSKQHNRCICGGKPLEQDYGESYAIRCKCGRGTSVFSGPNMAWEQWNEQNPVGLPTEITVKFSETLDEYIKMEKEGVLNIYGMAIDYNRGIYILNVRWN